MACLGKTTNSSGSSSSESQSPVIPVVEITRIRTPTRPGASALPLPTTKVKREEGANTEINEFAETAMNELLGWYGYGSGNATKKGVTNRPLPAANGDQQSGSAFGSVTITKSDLSPRNGQPRVARVYEKTGPPSPPSLSNSPSAQLTSEATSPNSRSCDWCHQKMSQEEADTFGTTEGVRFCSESCFAQSRRASFKRAKTCDWCRHVRHAVSYVDFQDGASQLQFCSDKCLNQYKMQIFIKETQAHLEMNPHLMEKSAGCGGNLITPELWLKNCRSRSASPERISRSGSASPGVSNKDASTTRRSTDLEATISSTVLPRPSITVAPVSKLLQPPTQSTEPVRSHATPAEIMANRPSMKTMRKRRTLRNGPPVRDGPTNFTTRPANEETLTQSSFNSRQMSPGNDTHHETQPRANGSIHVDPFNGQFLFPPPNLFPIRQSYLSGQGTGSPQIFRSPSENTSLPPLPILRPAVINREGHQHQQQSFPNFFHPSQFMGSQVSVPPVTVLVPCPIIMPIPVPIPIPINIPEFLLKLLAEMKGEESIRVEGSSQDKKASDLNNNRSASSTTGINMSMPNEPIEEQVAKEQNGSDSEMSGSESTHKSCEVVPKIKITRLQSKRILTTRELDSTRPLRKRKRIVVDAYT